MTNDNDLTAQILIEIREFDDICTDAEYTDTGEVWELLDRLRLICGETPPSDEDDDKIDDEADPSLSAEERNPGLAAAHNRAGPA